MLSRILAIEGAVNLDVVVAVSEDHADGSPHIHAFVQFKKRKDVRNVNYFDQYALKHGNYQKTRSVKAWVDYLKKTRDVAPERLAEWPEGIVDELLQANGVSGGKFALACAIVKNGGGKSEIDEQLPGFLMHHMRGVNEYERWWQSEQGRRVTLASVMEKLPAFSTTDLCDTGGWGAVSEWLHSNLRGGDRSFGQRQLYLWGDTSLGKTHVFVEWLSELSIYFAPASEHFYDEFHDNYHMVVFDEFDGRKPITWMNLFLQGGPCSVRRKGSQVQKKRNVPVVIISNVCPESVYLFGGMTASLPAFLRRVLSVHVTRRVTYGDIFSESQASTVCETSSVD